MSCVKCRLHETCRTVKVQSRGSESPQILFVGEAPGAEEDMQGKCFVGPAGELLMQAIKEYDLTPCFITNTVRCQPPGNRVPRVDEVNACFPYLAEEIKRLKPKYIVTLGNVALKALTGKEGITSYSGTIVKEIGGMKVFALYHPSFILRVPGMLPKFEMHLRGLRDLIQGESKEDSIKVQEVVFDEAAYLLDAMEGPIAFDYETSGLYKWQGGKVRAVGFSNGEKTFVVNAEEGVEELMKEFLKSDVEKCAYNSAFEIRWSLDEYGVAPKNLRYDPMLMHHLLDENSSKDLESVASKYLGVNKWDIGGLMLDNGWGYGTIPFKHLVDYCGKDAYYTQKLSLFLNKELQSNQMVNQAYWNLLLPLAKTCAGLERTGIKIDTKWASKNDEFYENRQTSLMKKMVRMDVIKSYSKQKREKNKKFEFNPGSSPQIRDIVFGSLGMTSEKTTKKGGLASTDQDVMEKLKDRHPFISTYMDWKNINTKRNNFLIKFPTFCDKDSFIHPSYNPCGTVTGRLASSNPPAQTFDEDPRIRGMVVSRFKGGSLIINDYSQLELRLLASEAEEERLLEAFAKGKDPHNITTEGIFGKGFTKAQRMIGKTINFGIAYGISAKSLSSKFNVDYETAEGWLDHFWKSYRKVNIWMEKMYSSVKKDGYIVSRFGRVRHLPEILNTQDKWLLARLTRQAGNFPIQSQGADINNLATIKIQQEMAMKAVTSALCLPVHDSTIIDTPPNETRQIQALCKEIMEAEMQKVCSWLKVKLEISQTTQHRWGN